MNKMAEYYKEAGNFLGAVRNVVRGAVSGAKGGLKATQSGIKPFSEKAWKKSPSYNALGLDMPGNKKPL